VICLCRACNGISESEPAISQQEWIQTVRSALADRRGVRLSVEGRGEDHPQQQRWPTVPPRVSSGPGAMSVAAWRYSVCKGNRVARSSRSWSARSTRWSRSARFRCRRNRCRAGSLCGADAGICSGAPRTKCRGPVARHSTQRHAAPWRGQTDSASC
jgi:hypothetical protein